MEQLNSFISNAENLAILNQNNVEILTKINDVVSTQSSSVNITYNNNGVTSTFALPTVNYLKNQIDIINQNIKRLSYFKNYCQQFYYV